MAKTVTRKRVEVLLDMPLLGRVEKLADKAGVKFYTILPTRGGGGEDGRWYDDRVTGGAGTRVLFSAITSEAGADAFIEALEPLLDSYNMIVTRSDVEVIRSEKF